MKHKIFIEFYQYTYSIPSCAKAASMRESTTGLPTSLDVYTCVALKSVA